MRTLQGQPSVVEAGSTKYSSSGSIGNSVCLLGLHIVTLEPGATLLNMTTLLTSYACWSPQSIVYILDKMALPSLQEIMEICVNERATIDYLVHHNALVIDDICELCGGDMSRKNITQLRCRRHNCRNTKSIFRNTMFAGGSRSVRCHEVLLLAYPWLCKSTYSTIQTQTHKSPKTISRWVRIFNR